MTARPAALYLTHFDLAPAVHPLAQSLEAEIPQNWDVGPEQDAIEARLAEAREAGRAEGIEEAERRAGTEMERLRDAAQEQLAAERQKWCGEEAAAIEDRLATALQRIEDELAECVARILRPFIVESLRRQMVNELVEHVASLLANREAMAIKIAGPADLLASLQERLAARPLAIAYEESDGVDVRVTAEQTTIETRLKAWINLIGGGME